MSLEKVNKKLLIIQQTLFYQKEGILYAMPHVENTLKLIYSNFYYTKIATITSNEDPPPGFTPFHGGDEVISLFARRKESTKLFQSFQYIKMIPFLWREIGKSDVVQLRIPSYPSFLASLICLLHRKSTLTSIHGDLSMVMQSRRPKSWIVKIASKIIDGLIHRITRNSKLSIVMGREALRVVKGNYFLSANYQFEESEIFIREDTCQGETIKLLFVGSIIKSKGIFELLEAVEILVKKGQKVQLTLIGDITDKSLSISIDRLIRLNLLVYAGFVPWGAALFDYYRQSDIFVFPSHSEGNPKAPMEALANSLPVVCTYPGSSNYIVHEENGLLINIKKVDELVVNIERMINDTSLRKKCIKNGIATARKNTRSTIAKNLSKEISQYYA